MNNNNHEPKCTISSKYPSSELTPKYPYTSPPPPNQQTEIIQSLMEEVPTYSEKPEWRFPMRLSYTYEKNMTLHLFRCAPLRETKSCSAAGYKRRPAYCSCPSVTQPFSNLLYNICLLSEHCMAWDGWELSLWQSSSFLLAAITITLYIEILDNILYFPICKLLTQQVSFLFEKIYSKYIT